MLSSCWEHVAARILAAGDDSIGGRIGWGRLHVGRHTAHHGGVILCVCVCVCVCVYVCACMCVCMYMWLHMCNVQIVLPIYDIAIRPMAI